MMEKFAQVIIDISNENVDKAFSYCIPPELANDIEIGTAVDVPFGRGNKLRKGYVIDIVDSIDIDRELIKPIASISKKSTSLEDRLICLAAWIKKRYGCTMAKALQTVLPVKYKVKKRVPKKAVGEGENKDRNTAENKPQNGNENKSENDVNESENKTENTNENKNEIKSSDETKNIILNDEQNAAAQTFANDYNNKNYKSYLLFGITGSGKTQVYIEMIKTVLALKRQVIVLVPEISLTYQTIVRLRAAFGDRVAIIHSKLNQGERYEQFERARDNSADIMIGPRSALFAPFNDIGLIIIDEEHDGSYKNETIPRYNTIDVAIERARLSNASVVLASATPSPDTYKNALDGRYTLLKLTKRASRSSALAKTHIVDMRRELMDGNKSIFSNELNKLILDRLDKKEQIMLFMNRRGYSSFVSCRSCGEVVMCPHCDISLTLHKDKGLICHYCGYRMELPKRCIKCGSPYIAEFGTGTQKLEQLTKKMYPKARVLRMDADTAAGKNAGKDILKAFSDGEADILVGTQMIVKGHDFKKVSLVGIIAADTSLYVSDYTSSQRTFELITQAAGRAGRADIKGDVVIQTYNPEHYAVLAAARQDYELYYNNEITFRKLAGYPPVMHMWTIQLSSKNEEKLQEITKIWANKLDMLCTKYNATIIGPTQAQIYKIKDYYRELIYIKHSDYDILIRLKDELEYSLQEDEAIREASVLYDFT